MKPLVKLAIELGPLAVFFIANAKADIYFATAAFMVATMVALGASYLLEGKVAVMPLITAGFVTVFGALTLWLDDATFIKLKPTLVNCLFAAIVLGARLRGVLVWKWLFGSAFTLTDEGWWKLQNAWGIWFACLAVVNEVVWRNFSTDTWVSFKVFGLMPLTLIFSLSLLPMMMRHMPEEEEQQAADSEDGGEKSGKSEA